MKSLTLKYLLWVSSSSVVLSLVLTKGFVDFLSIMMDKIPETINCSGKKKTLSMKENTFYVQSNYVLLYGVYDKLSWTV